MIHPSARRLLVFAVAFTGLMSIVIWQAGGLRSQTRAGKERARPAAPPMPDTVLDVKAGAGMGPGTGVRIQRNRLAVVNGEPVLYCAFQADWARQTPKSAARPGEKRLHAEVCRILFFHQVPTPEHPRPRAVEGPNTTRVEADRADLTMGEGDAFQADLDGNVVLTRHETDGDVVLRTDSLDCDAETSRAVTEDRVEILGRGATLEGVGMDADLQEPRATLLSKVRGVFAARRGALTGQGATRNAEVVPTILTCDGLAELRSLSARARREGTPWLATFHRNVFVEQDESSISCQRLEVTFLMPSDEAKNEARVRGQPEPGIEVLRLVAEGDVYINASRESDIVAVRTEHATSTRDPGGLDRMVFTGGTQMTFRGTLEGDRNADGQARGRIDVQCSGPASVFYERQDPERPEEPVQARAVFEDDVVARQWLEDGTRVQTEVRAPLVTLLGQGTVSQRFDPQAVTANGTREEPARVRRLGLEAHAQDITWQVLREQNVERLTLVGDPEARFEDRSGLNPLGEGRVGADGTLVVAARDELVLVYPREIGPDGKRVVKSDGAAVSARGKVVARRMIGDREAYRLTADRADVGFAPDRRPREMHAYGGVVLAGQGERPGDRHAVLRGDRLTAKTAGTPRSPDGTLDPWTETSVVVFGETRAPASVEIEESADAAGVERVHEIRAQELRYEESGRLVVARRGAEASLNQYRGRGPEGTDFRNAPIHVRASELRAVLNPPDPNAPRGRPNLRTLSGSGGVVVEGQTQRVRGDDLVYDHAATTAVVRGRPARASQREQGPYESYVESSLIRAEFSASTAGRARFERVRCQGGQIVGFIPGSRASGGSEPKRMQVDATGPIVVDDRHGSATGNVVVVYDTMVGRQRLRRDADLRCERLDIWFDPNVQGPLRNRVTRVLARGSSGRPVRLVTPKFEATAQEVEGLGDWLHLRRGRGPRVHVTERDPVREFFMDGGSWNVTTYEWKDFIRMGIR